MALHPDRALRVGVLLRDNLVEERVFVYSTERPHKSRKVHFKPITFGQSLRCTLSVPVDGLPAEHVLFALDQGRMLLRVIPTMTGRLAIGGTIETTLPETVTLGHGTRGRLRIGEATILFQEIAAPPVTPRPRLPASIRGSFSDRIDRRLAVIIGGSLLMHVGIATWAWATDRDTGSMFEPKLGELHQVTMPDIALDLTTPQQPDPTAPGTATPVAPIQTPAPIVPRHAIHHDPTPSDPSRLRDDADRMAAILTGNDRGAHGPGEMAHRHPGADLDKQIEDVRDRHISIGDGKPTSRDVPGFHIGTDHGPAVDDPTLTLLSHRPEDQKDGRITLHPIPTHEVVTTLTVDSVLAKISGAYMAGLQRCYKKGLVRDASLSGKVSLAFTVDETGHLAAKHASGVSTDVDGCIDAQMDSWRFSIPKDKDGDPTDANFGLMLVLQPS